jgi:hypothetical protein
MAPTGSIAKRSHELAAQAQGEDAFSMALRNILILKLGAKRHVEGRAMLIQPGRSVAQGNADHHAR